MSFTYDITGPVGQVRLEIQDTTEPALFTDEEITYKLQARAGVVLLAAADLCGILARRFAQEYDFATDGQSFKRGQRADSYLKLEASLLARAGGGLGVVETTKIDGYSDDLSSRDGAGSVPATGHVRTAYTNPDQPY